MVTEKTFSAERAGEIVNSLLSVYYRKISVEQRRSIKSANNAAMSLNNEKESYNLLKGLIKILQNDLGYDVQFQILYSTNFVSDTYVVSVTETHRNMDRLPLKKRKSKSINTHNLTHALILFEDYIDETIEKIEIENPTTYVINEVWTVDISTKQINRITPEFLWE